MEEFLGEIIGELLLGLIGLVLCFIGATVRWSFFRGLCRRTTKTFQQYMVDEKTNIGLAVLLIAAGVLGVIA
jgi:hypothetical protein